MTKKAKIGVPTFSGNPDGEPMRSNRVNNQNKKSGLVAKIAPIISFLTSLSFINLVNVKIIKNEMTRKINSKNIDRDGFSIIESIISLFLFIFGEEYEFTEMSRT